MKKIFFLLALFVGQLLGADQKPATLNMQPVHEAFVQKVTAPVPLEVVPKQPPAALSETPPQQPSQQMIWIPGYWSGCVSNKIMQIHPLVNDH